VTILGCSALIATRRPLPLLDYTIWAILLSAALIFHDSHKAIAWGMFALGIVWNIRKGWANWRGFVTMALALGIAAIAQLAFNYGVSRLVGSAPLYPPFLVARVIEDGPGYRYLKATCPGNGFAVCQFLDRLPMNSDEFLWAARNRPGSGRPGVFAEAPPETKRQLAAEQLPLVLNVLRFDPTGEALAGLRHALRQLTLTGLSEFQYTDEEKQFFEYKVPVSDLLPLRGSAAYQGTVPIRGFEALQLGVVVAAAIFLVVALVRSSASVTQTLGAAALTAWILVGMLVNGVVCGVLSGPHDRYSVRVLWLLPFAALLVGREIWPNRFRFNETSTASLGTL
jgi:hypothetical protein